MSNKYHIAQTGKNAGKYVPCNAKVACRIGGEHISKEQAEIYNIKMLGEALLDTHYSNIVYVEDNWGSHFELREGVLNDEARYIFRNGQCLALATQLAKHFGTNKITVVSMITESDDYDDIYEREGNEPIEEAYRHIIHAYANADNTDDEVLYDVDGEIFKDSVVEEYNIVSPNKAEIGDYIIETYTVDGARYMFESFMTEQDYDFAQTIVPKILETK